MANVGARALACLIGVRDVGLILAGFTQGNCKTRFVFKKDQSVFRVQLSSVVVLSLGFQSEAFTQYQSLGPTPSD